MKISTEEQGRLGANCYMLSSDKTTVCIDPSELSKNLLSFLEGNSGKELFIVATHRHYDHVAAIAEIKERFGGKIAVSKADACGIENDTDSLGTYFGMRHKTASPDIFLSEGEIVLGDISFRVLETPGHTEGSICLITENVIFSGDTLFCMSIGRTDFPSGSMADMQRSLKKLFSLPGDYTVYPGHGESTTLYFEKQNNPYYFREF